jgi:hypothetical protein
MNVRDINGGRSDMKIDERVPFPIDSIRRAANAVYMSGSS